MFILTSVQHYYSDKTGEYVGLMLFGLKATFEGRKERRFLIETEMRNQEFVKRFNDWQAGSLIQYCFPMFSDEQREFMITGMTPEEWKEEMGEEE